jgi:hypothetical protein
MAKGAMRPNKETRKPKKDAKKPATTSEPIRAPAVEAIRSKKEK